MSCINVGVPPEWLPDELLLEEHHEIKRVTAHFKRISQNNNLDNLSNRFTKTPNNLLFFLNKGYFTHVRYQKIFLECKKRGFQTANFNQNWLVYFMRDEYRAYYQNYYPTNSVIEATLINIADRIVNSPKTKFHYHKKEITKQEALFLINTYYVTTSLMCALS